MEKHEPVAITRFLEAQEIQRATWRGGSEPVQGYMFRLEASSVLTGKRETLPWIFGSMESIHKMLAQWQAKLAVDGIGYPQDPTG